MHVSDFQRGAVSGWAVGRDFEVTHLFHIYLDIAGSSTFGVLIGLSRMRVSK